MKILKVGHYYLFNYSDWNKYYIKILEFTTDHTTPNYLYIIKGNTVRLRDSEIVNYHQIYISEHFYEIDKGVKITEISKRKFRNEYLMAQI